MHLNDIEHEKLMEVEKERQASIDELERLPPDEAEGFRRHAWVAMIKYAPWCYKPEFKKPANTDEDDDLAYEPSAFFIEPSTGFRHEVTDPCYMTVETIWNHQNYFVNRQCPEISIANMKWNLKDRSKWEHLLIGEPYELREPVVAEVVKDPLKEQEDDVLATEKHLDMPFSWVDTLHINTVDFEERYVGGEKKEFYKYAIYEKFAPYTNTDGLMKRLTYYETLDYENPLTKYEWYENRDDLLETITVDLKTNKTAEQFLIGRPDSLKVHVHYPGEKREIILKFYSINRFDCLKKLNFHSSYIEEYYENRRDL